MLGFPDWFAARFCALSRTSPFFYAAVWAPNVAALALTATRGGWIHAAVLVCGALLLVGILGPRLGAPPEAHPVLAPRTLG